MKPLNNKMINAIFVSKKMSRPFKAPKGGWPTQGVALGYLEHKRKSERKAV